MIANLYDCHFNDKLNEVLQMKGYLLNFYKFSPSYNEQMSAITTEGFNRSIVWSVFDRLEIKKVVDFAEYRKSDAGEKNWLGERQFAMLYELKEGNFRELIGFI